MQASPKQTFQTWS